MELYRCEKCQTTYDEIELEDLNNSCGCGYTFQQDKWTQETPARLKSLSIEARVTSEYLEVDWSDGEGYYYMTSIFSEDMEFTNIWRHKTREDAMNCHRKVVNALYFGKFTVHDYEITVSELP